MPMRFCKEASTTGLQKLTTMYHFTVGVVNTFLALVLVVLHICAGRGYLLAGFCSFVDHLHRLTEKLHVVHLLFWVDVLFCIHSFHPFKLVELGIDSTLIMAQKAEPGK
mmetsp:Transcript_43337/g.77875  ORF Transcript_43337/g.77875 Transcript_43337/m.77875 type:complete len:109 (-) Transcript_43337:364-690(-)